MSYTYGTLVNGKNLEIQNTGFLINKWQQSLCTKKEVLGELEVRLNLFIMFEIWFSSIWSDHTSLSFGLCSLMRNLWNFCSYEAWVIYNFLSLCLAWVGGPGAVVLSLSGRVLKPSWWLMTCCFPAIPLDGYVGLSFLLDGFLPASEAVGTIRVIFIVCMLWAMHV